MTQTKTKPQPKKIAQFYCVKNWEEFQQYKDRDPKWIKLHREVLDDYELDSISEVDQLHLIKIWLLAAKVENRIPNDPNWIARKIGAKSKVNLEQLVTLGFLVPYKSVQMTQADPYLEEEAEAEAEAEKETEQKRPIGQQADRFDLFWSVYPRKVKKAEARKVWKSRKLDRLADQIVTDVENRQQMDRQWLEGYVPHPTTYLRGARWEDDIEQPKRVESAVERATREALEWRQSHGQA